MDSQGEWFLSPAYDVVFSDGPGGEHSLDIAGEGKNPGIEDFYRVGESIGLDLKKMKKSISQVREAVANWPVYAKSNGVSRKETSSISKVLCYTMTLP